MVMKRILGCLMAAAIVLTMATPAMAKDRDHHSSREWREHHEHHGHEGWDKGRKTGWHGNNMPPGQAKKHRDYERERWAREHRNHHHRTTYAHNRRPVVTPRTNPYPVRTYPTRTYPTRTYPTQQTQHGRGPIPVPNVGATPGQRPTTTAQKPTGQGGPIPVPGR